MMTGSLSKVCVTKLLTHHFAHAPLARNARLCSSMPPQERLLSRLEDRGLLADLTSRDFPAATAPTPPSVYLGVDPSSDSMHVGNLLAVKALKHFQKAGYRPIFLVHINFVVFSLSPFILSN